MGSCRIAVAAGTLGRSVGRWVMCTGMLHIDWYAMSHVPPTTIHAEAQWMQYALSLCLHTVWIPNTRRITMELEMNTRGWRERERRQKTSEKGQSESLPRCVHAYTYFIISCTIQFMSATWISCCALDVVRVFATTFILSVTPFLFRCSRHRYIYDECV